MAKSRTPRVVPVVGSWSRARSKCLRKQIHASSLSTTFGQPTVPIGVYYNKTERLRLI